MPRRLFAVVEALALALWIGALAGFAFVYAPIAFNVVTDLDRFAALVARTIRALTVLGFVCGPIAIGAALIRSRWAPARLLAFTRILLVALALALGAYDAYAVVPRMETTLRSFHGPFVKVPKSDPRRIAYDDLHAESSRVYGAALLLGLAAIAISAVGATPQHRPRHSR
jgi:hypothetical protein